MAKADKPTAARRVEEVLRIRLDGAEFWDVRDFVREKEQEQGSAWFLDQGETPLSDSQIRRYQQQADARMMESIERSRKKLFRQHLAKRRNLYGRAVTTGEIRTALACLQDEAQLLHLYDPPARKPDEQPVEMDRKKRLEQSVAFWESILRTSPSAADRMKAQERIDKLLGLECADLEEILDALEARLEERDRR